MKESVYKWKLYLVLYVSTSGCLRAVVGALFVLRATDGARFWQRTFVLRANDGVRVSGVFLLSDRYRLYGGKLFAGFCDYLRHQNTL